MKCYNLFQSIELRENSITELCITFDFYAQTCEDMMASILVTPDIKVVQKNLSNIATADNNFLQADCDEKYAIEVSASEVVLYADTVRALAYALCSLKTMTEVQKDIRHGMYLSYPSFKIRGLVEAFYGKPWSMEQRIHAIGVMAEHRMNTYIYGPKDDPYHRDYWRKSYDDQGISTLKSMFELCTKNHMTLYYMLAPGLDIKYHDKTEIDVITDKLMQVYRLGVRRFGLLFDDIPEKFIYPQDAEMFDSLAAAHVSIVNGVYEKLMSIDNSIQLITCPTQYFGEPNDPYITEFGKGVPNDCLVYFTGEKICSAKITSQQAQSFIENTDHMPLYWDNYPVNDMEMVNEFHISPIINRDADLWKYSEGITLNPMEFAQSSLINTITYAHYMWDSKNYDPEQSFTLAIEQVAGKEYVEAFRFFNSFLYKSCLVQHGYHYRFETPTAYHSELVAMIEADDYNGIYGYMKEAKTALACLKSLPEKFYMEFFRWHESAIACCDVFMAAALNVSRGEEFKAVLPSMLDYLCRAEDILKHEAKLIIRKNMGAD